jgi:hypothetical protein
MIEESVFSPQIIDTKKKEVMDRTETKTPVEACLGVSEKWEAREAGREVAETALKNLTRPPDFFLLFSSIHYKDYGGFQELLNGVWDVLPKGTPLIGGTVVGFMNNYDVYTRGVTALAVSYPNIDTAIGVGHNIKRNPQKAAKQNAAMIDRKLALSSYRNKFLLNFVSSAKVMKIPGQGYRKVIDSGFVSKFVTLGFGFSQYLLQKGPGREDEFFEEIIKEMPNYSMILGTSVDDYKGISNYQFFNKTILTDSVVNLGLATDLDFDVCTTHGMKTTDIKFKITKLSRDGHIIREINGQPAVQELLKLLDWPEGYLNEKTMFHRILYYPISVKRHGRDVPVVMPFILGDAIVTPCLVDKSEVSILTVSGRDLVSSVKENISHFNHIQPEFGLFSACGTILQTLGYKTDIIRKVMLDYFREKPFLMFFCAGEGSYSPTKNINYANMSVNTAIFGYKK